MKTTVKTLTCCLCTKKVELASQDRQKSGLDGWCQISASEHRLRFKGLHTIQICLGCSRDIESKIISRDSVTTDETWTCDGVDCNASVTFRASPPNANVECMDTSGWVGIEDGRTLCPNCSSKVFGVS